MHYARLKITVFCSRLKSLWSVISWSDVGSEFHAAGPANAELRSPNLRRDESQVVHIVDCSQNGTRNEMWCWRSTWLVQTYTTNCIRYEWGAWDDESRLHNLYVTRCSTGSQCSSYKPASRDQADRDHRSVSWQHSERAAMERWLTSARMPMMARYRCLQ